MKAELRRFIALLDELEARGRLPDVAGLSAEDREALQIAERLFGARVQLAPPALQGILAEGIHGPVVASPRPSVIAFPTFPDAGTRSSGLTRWLSGGLAAAALAGILLLARGMATGPHPVDPSRWTAPEGSGLRGPAALPPEEGPGREEGPSQLPPASDPTRPASATPAPAGLATSRPSGAAAGSPSPKPEATLTPAGAEPPKDEPADAEKRGGQASPAASETAASTPAAQPTVTEAAPSPQPPTEDPSPSTPTSPPPPPPIMTMEPLPTDPPTPAPGP
jgi:hypothetical protein